MSASKKLARLHAEIASTLHTDRRDFVMKTIVKQLGQAKQNSFETKVIADVEARYGNIDDWDRGE